MKFLAWTPLVLGTALVFKLPFPYSLIGWMIGAFMTDTLRRRFDRNRPPDSPMVKQLRWWGWAFAAASFLRFIPSKFCLIGFITCMTLSWLIAPEDS